MKKYVTYYRVSTQKQKRSGLGLEAQRRAVGDLLKRRRGEVVREFEEVETGTRKKERPVLRRAIRYCQATKATLVIAKLDRLARNVHFITGLIESGVKFVAADDPDLDMERNPEYVQLKAVIAEKEARMISERTKEALAEAKARGVKLGNSQPGRIETIKERHGEDVFVQAGHRGAHRSAEVRRDRNEEHYKEVVPIIVTMREEGHSWQDIVDTLNEEGYCTSRGNAFSLSSVHRLHKGASA